MSRWIRDLQLVDARVPLPADQTFALTFAYTGARFPKPWQLPQGCRPRTASIRIRTLKRRVEHWREVPVPSALLRALVLVHALRSAPGKAAGRPLWPWFRATAHRKIPQDHGRRRHRRPSGLSKGSPAWHHDRRRRRAAPDDHGHAWPRQPQTTAIYATAAGLEARDFLARAWEREEYSGGFDACWPLERA